MFLVFVLNLLDIYFELSVNNLSFSTRAIYL